MPLPSEVARVTVTVTVTVTVVATVATIAVVAVVTVVVVAPATVVAIVVTFLTFCSRHSQSPFRYRYLAAVDSIAILTFVAIPFASPIALCVATTNRCRCRDLYRQLSCCGFLYTPFSLGFIIASSPFAFSVAVATSIAIAISIAILLIIVILCSAACFLCLHCLLYLLK